MKEMQNVMAERLSKMFTDINNKNTKKLAPGACCDHEKKAPEKAYVRGHVSSASDIRDFPAYTEAATQRDNSGSRNLNGIVGDRDKGASPLNTLLLRQQNISQ